jgi:hypothetical protein
MQDIHSSTIAEGGIVLERKPENRRMREALEEILRRVDALPTEDTRSEDEILGYDEYGTPRSE